MERKFCSLRNIEKHIIDFYQFNTECNDCNIKRGLERYYETKDEISDQRKICYEKSKDKILRKQNDRYIHF